MESADGQWLRWSKGNDVDSLISDLLSPSVPTLIFRPIPEECLCRRLLIDRHFLLRRVDSVLPYIRLGEIDGDEFEKQKGTEVRLRDLAAGLGAQFRFAIHWDILTLKVRGAFPLLWKPAPHAADPILSIRSSDSKASFAKKSAFSTTRIPFSPRTLPSNRLEACSCHEHCLLID